MSRHLLRPGLRHALRLPVPVAGGVFDWWLAGGTINSANVLEHVESPTVAQLYAGASVTGGNAWTIAARGTSGDLRDFAFSSQTGALYFGRYDADNGIYLGAAWNNRTLFVTDEDHVYFAISDGSSVQLYRDGSAVGAAITSAVGIGGTSKWRDSFSGSTGSWGGAFPAGAVYNIALSATQRAELYSAMAAL